MEKLNFDIICKGLITNLNNKEQEYRGFNEFRHFCDRVGLLAELSDHTLEDKIINCSLFLKKDKYPIKFDFYNKLDQKYYTQFYDIFKELENYKNNYIVTLFGQEDDPIIIWG